MGRANPFGVLMIVAVMGCAGGGSEPGPADGGGGGGGDAGAPDAGEDGRTDAGTADGGEHADAGGFDYEPPALRGQLFVAHYLGDHELFAFDTDTLEQTSGSPKVIGRPTGDVLALGDVVAVTIEGAEAHEILALDAESLNDIEGSPYDTGRSPVALAHDTRRNLLYVYCIGTPGEPEESLLTVYDTTTIPWQQLDGSPFRIDVPATQLAVDPVSGRVFGVSLSKVWAVEAPRDAAVRHLPGSPREIEDGSGSGIALDPARRRLYFNVRSFGEEQSLHALDLDSFEPVDGSPVAFPGRSAGDVVVHPLTGDVFVVDYGRALLHSIRPDPLALRDGCGGEEPGCAIAPTETGLALDHERHRLFIPALRTPANPDASRGYLTAWSVEDPAAPVELTDESAPQLDYFPNRVAIR